MNRLARLAAVISVLVPVLATASWALPQPGSAVSWIDAPLGWVTITSTPVAVVAHSTSPTGVAEMRLDVDGATVASTKPSAPDTLVNTTFRWRPDHSGTYLLEVFGRDTAQAWGQPGTIEVTVDLGAAGSSTTTSPLESTTTGATTTTTTVHTTTTAGTTTTTATTTTTTTTRPTTTTTTAPCTTGDAIAAPDRILPTRTGVVTLGWSYNGCQEPRGFEVQVSRDPAFSSIFDSYLGAPGSRQVDTVPALPCGITWYWRVRADTGSWSSGPSFTSC